MLVYTQSFPEKADAFGADNIVTQVKHMQSIVFLHTTCESGNSAIPETVVVQPEFPERVVVEQTLPERDGVVREIERENRGNINECERESDQIRAERGQSSESKGKREREQSRNQDGANFAGSVATPLLLSPRFSLWCFVFEGKKKVSPPG